MDAEDVRHELDMHADPRHHVTDYDLRELRDEIAILREEIAVLRQSIPS